MMSEGIKQCLLVEVTSGLELYFSNPIPDLNILKKIGKDFMCSKFLFNLLGKWSKQLICAKVHFYSQVNVDLTMGSLECLK